MRELGKAKAVLALLTLCACSTQAKAPAEQARRDVAPITAGLQLLKDEVEQEAIAAAGQSPLGGLALPDLGETVDDARFDRIASDEILLEVDGASLRLAAPQGGEFLSGVFVSAGAPGALIDAWPGRGVTRVMIARASRHDFAAGDPTPERLAETFGEGDGAVMMDFLYRAEMVVTERAVYGDRAEIAFTAGEAPVLIDVETLTAPGDAEAGADPAQAGDVADSSARPKSQEILVSEPVTGWLGLRPLGDGLVAMAIAENRIGKTTHQSARDWVAATLAAVGPAPDPYLDPYVDPDPNAAATPVEVEVEAADAAAAMDAGGAGREGAQ